MFARVITTQVGNEGFDDLIRSADQELPAARQRPGFAGYYLLTDDSTGMVVVISLWQTREDMDAVAEGTERGIHDDVLSGNDSDSLRLETYEVALHA
ncbi:antibiotic biosynthesis monooxygenase family protein [uncultured Jatrophihabitans sp.]|uniref:antibiotic biosynthesis monooxygenase family protein n=1 Tax=uncultured Jatrophihabitans sp. TaxID=1610747 RepID=UPI0035CB0D61